MENLLVGIVRQNWSTFAASKQVMTALQPLIASPPAGYRIELGGSIEEATKANTALGKIFPVMIAPH